MYLTLETEQEHCEGYGDETTAEVIPGGLWALEEETGGWSLLGLYPYSEAREKETQISQEGRYVRTRPAEKEDFNEHVETVKTTLVCSCGYTTCPLIGMYGHPRPVFSSDIEPIPSQAVRDRRALELKGMR